MLAAIPCSVEDMSVVYSLFGAIFSFVRNLQKWDLLVPVIEILGSHSPFHARVLGLCCFVPSSSDWLFGSIVLYHLVI